MAKGEDKGNGMWRDANTMKIGDEETKVKRKGKDALKRAIFRHYDHLTIWNYCLSK